VDAFGSYTHKQRTRVEKITSEPVLTEEKTIQQQPETKPAEEVSAPVPTPATQTLYGVQVCASRTALEPSDPKLKGQKCSCLQIGNWYKYYVGPFPTKEDAQNKQNELKSLFPDCWVIQLKNE